jgi:hypothetical protein
MCSVIAKLFWLIKACNEIYLSPIGLCDLNAVSNLTSQQTGVEVDAWDKKARASISFLTNNKITVIFILPYQCGRGIVGAVEHLQHAWIKGSLC